MYCIQAGWNTVCRISLKQFQPIAVFFVDLQCYIAYGARKLEETVDDVPDEGIREKLIKASIL